MKTILVPTDFNELATAALEFAVALARPTGAELTVLYADTFEPPAEFTATQMHQLVEAIDASRQHAATELAHYAHEHVPEDLHVRTVVRDSTPATAIAEEARDVDLVVMGTHSRGPISRLLLGSVAQSVLGRTATPVLTVPRRAVDARVDRVLAFPGTETMAGEVARLLGAALQPVESHDINCLDGDLIVVPRPLRASVIRHVRVPVLAV